MEPGSLPSPAVRPTGPGPSTTRAPATGPEVAVHDDVPAPRCSAWLAAYALGLAHTASSGQVAVRELVATAAGRTQLLREARGHLAALVDVDHELRERTRSLLTEAVQASASHDG